MEICLFILFLVLCVYCCDIPAWKGFEFMVNNHDSLSYSIAVSIISSYVFYLFQVVIPRSIRFKRIRSTALDRLDKLEKMMHKMLCCLQGVPPNSSEIISKDLIRNYLNSITIFDENSIYVIQQHKELSVFEALIHYDNEIVDLVNELITGQYLESKYEYTLLKVKKSALHDKIISWMDNLPGEFERRNQKNPGYTYVNLNAVNSDIVSSLDEYQSLYKDVIKIKQKIKKKLHML